ncbi:MAG: hypothetical protein P8X74_20555 [Reinekea sp.]|jgi:hypothetical protein
MIRQIQFTLTQRPAWQRTLIYLSALVIAGVLFWIGILFVFAFAVLALGVAIINRIKFKLTGRPLFKGPQHFHRYHSQFRENSRRQNDVIEGEVTHKDDD